MCCLHIYLALLIAHSKIILYKSKEKSLQDKEKSLQSAHTQTNEEKTMCYQVDVISLEDNQAIITVGESKFIAYHDTEVNVEEGFDDCWDYARESHYTKATASMKSMLAQSLILCTSSHLKMMIPMSVWIFIFQVTESARILTRAIEDAIALAAISRKKRVRKCCK